MEEELSYHSNKKGGVTLVKIWQLMLPFELMETCQKNLFSPSVGKNKNKLNQRGSPNNDFQCSESITKKFVGANLIMLEIPVSLKQSYGLGFSCWLCGVGQFD